VCMHNNSPALVQGDFISSFASTYEEVDRACRWMEDKLAQSDSPEGIDRDFILLCAREALLNAVEHGNDRNPSARIEAGLYVKENELKITITDEGKGFDLNENLLHPDDLTLKQIGRRGLSFAHSTAQKILVEKGAVTMIFTAKPSRKEE
ncbi:MAG: ATP-binding protein, partial [Desulfobacteraceae bacterium]